MRLIFNRNDDFSREAKEMLAFVDADVEFLEMKSDIRSATRSFIKQFGAGLYDQFLAIYEAIVDVDPDAEFEEEVIPDIEDPIVDDPLTDDPLGDAPEEEIIDPVVPLTQEEELEIMEQIQVVILLDAYRTFIRNRDIAHTPDGRKMRLDANEKLPFDWLLDRSNASLDRKYYNSVDELLELIQDLQVWKTSKAYELMHSAWVHSTDHLQEFYPQGNRMLLMKLAPGLLRAQRKEIKSRIGSERYLEYDAIVKSAVPSEDFVVSDIIAKCREAIILSAIHWALVRLRVTIFPEGILQAYTGDRNTTKARKVPENSAIELTALAYKNDAAARLLELEAMVTALQPIEVKQANTTNRPLTMSDPDDKFLAL